VAALATWLDAWYDELEAERNREHAKFMADWREAMKRPGDDAREQAQG
jgi:hypothetical protein